MPRSSSRLAGKRVDYAKVENRYKGMKFTGRITKPRHRHLARGNHGSPGRANAAPPLTSWPFLGQHVTVTYVEDISTDTVWANPDADQIRLPFRHLDVRSIVTWQGLIQEVAGLDTDAKAESHFDAITHAMRTNGKQTVITECVGEAAAAICMLTDSNYTGYEMIWGFDTHSGTGIDQIWRKDLAVGAYSYLIVEAKGPGAGLNSGLWVPPNYAQMEEGWVLNHLHSMSKNKHSAGVEIVKNLKLEFDCLHPNYNGASKSYYGLGKGSKHKQSASRLCGVVVTANWLSNGRLGYTISNKVRYLT